MQRTQFVFILGICSSLSLLVGCTPKSDRNPADQQTTASNPTANQQQRAQDYSRVDLRAFPATPYDAQDIAELDDFNDKFNHMQHDLNENIKQLQQQGNLTPEMLQQRQREYLRSALNMLHALNLRTEQGRYIQGLLYQYWESQAQQPIPANRATTEQPILLESDTVDKTAYLSAQAQLKKWKSLQTET